MENPNIFNKKILSDIWSTFNHVIVQGPWVVDVGEDIFEGAHPSSNMSSNLPVAAVAAASTNGQAAAAEQAGTGSNNANMSAKIAAAFNQGFSTLGGRLGNTF